MSEQEMTDKELRLRCLEMAAHFFPAKIEDSIVNAQVLYDFLNKNAN